MRENEFVCLTFCFSRAVSAVSYVLCVLACVSVPATILLAPRPRHLGLHCRERIFAKQQQTQPRRSSARWSLPVLISGWICVYYMSMYVVICDGWLHTSAHESTDPRAGVYVCMHVLSSVICDLLVSDPGAATAENAAGGNNANGRTGAKAKVATNACF